MNYNWFTCGKSPLLFKYVGLGDILTRGKRFQNEPNRMITRIMYFTGVVVGLVIQKFGGSVAIYLGSLAAAGKTSSFIHTRKLVIPTFYIAMLKRLFLLSSQTKIKPYGEDQIYSCNY